MSDRTKKEKVLAFIGVEAPSALPKSKAMLENAALNAAVLPGVLGEINWNSGNPEAEKTVFDAMVLFHADELTSGRTIVSVLQSAVTTKTVAARCVIPLVDEVCTLLKWLAMGATAGASSTAFITHIDTIISVIVAPGYNLIEFLSGCWWYLSGPDQPVIPPAILQLFGAACNRKTVGLIFYAILLRLRTTQNTAAAVNAAVAAVPPVHAVGQGMPDPTIMASIQNVAIKGVRWFLQYLCSIPEFICVGLGGANPITSAINESADKLICGWMAAYGLYARDKFDSTLSAYLHQKHLLSVFAPAFINDRRQLDKNVFDILWAQEAERVIAAIMLKMMNAIRERDPLGMRDVDSELVAQSQCREWLLVVCPHCMDGMLTRAQLEAHANSYRQQASDLNYDPSSMDSGMAQPGSQTEGSQNLSGEDVLLLTHVQTNASHLLTRFCESEIIQGGKRDLAKLGGFFFADDWEAWNAETGVKPKKYTKDEMAQLLAAPADLRTFFEKIIKYIANNVHTWLVKHPDRFGSAADEGHAYKKWSRFLDSIMRISILLKNQYKIDFDTLGRLILSLNTDGVEPDPIVEAWWTKMKPVVAEYAEDRPFMKRYVFGLIGRVVSGVIGVMNDVKNGFSRSDDDDIEAACEIILGPVLAEPVGSGEALAAAGSGEALARAAANDESTPISVEQLLISGTNLSNWGWVEEMKGPVVPAAGEAEAGEAEAGEAEAEAGEAEAGEAEAGMEEKVTAPQSAEAGEAEAGMEEKVTAPHSAEAGEAEAGMEEKVTAPQSAEAAESLASMSGKWGNRNPPSRATTHRTNADLAAADGEAVANTKLPLPRDRSPSPPDGGKSRRKSRKNSKKTIRRNKGRKSSNTAKKSQQQRARNSIRRRRSSRKGRK